MVLLVRGGPPWRDLTTRTGDVVNYVT